MLEGTASARTRTIASTRPYATVTPVSPPQKLGSIFIMNGR